MRTAYEQAPQEIRRNRDLIIELLRQSLRRIIRKTTQTRPVVVPIIVESTVLFLNPVFVGS